MATENLLCHHGAFEALIAEKSLGDRCQQLRQGQAVGIVLVLGGIEAAPNQHGESSAGLGVGANREQHAAHVRMHQQGVRLGAGVLRTGGRPALQAVLGVGGGLLISQFARAKPLQTDRQALVVHHGEHAGQARILLAYPIADGIVVVHHVGGTGHHPHLVLNGTARHRIARAEGAVRVGNELRHDEQADAPGARRCAGNAGKHQVNDVLRQVVLTAGNEDLGAGDAVGAIACIFRSGAQQAQVGACMGFGEIHGAGPFTAVELGQIERLLGFAAVGIDAYGSAQGQGAV